jgi:hypothetical protein
MLGRTSRQLLSAAVIGFLSAGSALAAPLTAGNTLFPAPGEPDPTDGGNVVASLTTPFHVPGFFIGSLTATVVENDPANPYPGGLTFTYIVNNDPTSPNAIARMTTTQWASFLTDASYQIPATGRTPALIDRLTSDVVGYSFSGIGSGQILPGMTSALLVVQTDAAGWQQTTASIIDSGAITINTLGPNIPEPATLGFLSLAAGAILMRRRS